MSAAPRYLALLLAAIFVQTSVHAQNAPNPTVGGSVQNEDDSAATAKRVRRQILQDTTNRQYTAEEIDAYRKIIDGYERAQTGVYSEVAKVGRRRVKVGLSPDDGIPELRMNAENPTALVFTDLFGRPWAVQDASVPAFLDSKIHGSMVILTPKPKNKSEGGEGGVSRFGRGSLMVLLEGLTSVVSLQLSYGLSRTIDGQLEVQLPIRNAAADKESISIPTNAAPLDEVAGAFLDGEPPRDAQKLPTSHTQVQAWAHGGKLYLRTRLAMQSPAFQMFGASSNGVSVYRFDKPPSIVNALDGGSVVAVAIGE